MRAIATSRGCSRSLLEGGVPVNRRRSGTLPGHRVNYGGPNLLCDDDDDDAKQAGASILVAIVTAAEAESLAIFRCVCLRSPGLLTTE